MNKSTNNRIYDSVTLYRVVYLSRFVLVTVVLLLVSFLMQPIDRAFANETAESEVPESAVVSEPEPEPEEELQPEAEVPVEAEEIVEPEESPATTSVDEATEVSDDVTLAEEGAEAVVDESGDSDEASSGAVAEEGAAETADEIVVETLAQASTTEESDVLSETEAAASATSSEGLPQAASTTDSASETVDDTSEDEESSDVSQEEFATTTVETTATTTPSAVSHEAAASTTPTDTASGEESNAATGSAAEEAVPDTEATEPVSTENDSNETPTMTDETESGDSEATVEEAAQTLNPAETATTTEGTPVAVAVETGSVINDENRHQFSVNECISVGDGAYYCSKNEAEAVGVGDMTESGVYADFDAEGDKEIFYKVGKQVMQITDNQYDDDAPYIDSVDHEIVWHRLVGGRYQIMQYSIDSGEETQLTATGDNNMEPAMAEGVVVWQRWIDNNWEIVLYEDGVETRLSDNEQHDVAPAIRDGYVMWHTLSPDGGKQLVVYELETGLTSEVADPDGGHVENPRFVLVYDTVLDNGDTITKEYDPETGTVRPIASDPAPLPSKIPDPEPVEEAKALVGVKVNGKDDMLDDIATTTPSTEGDDDSVRAAEEALQEVATSSADFTGDVVLDLSEGESETLELTEFDLIVEPFNATSSAQATATGSPALSVE